MNVLDKGFVELVDFFGGDSAVVQAARVSYGEGSKGEEKDRKLITYLLTHDHQSPFEMSLFKFHIKCPIFVARQLMRHRICSYNEISGRYTVFDDTEYYLPEKIRIEHPNNKQASVDANWDITEHKKVIDTIEDTTLNTISIYKNLIEKGIAKELARMVLPLNMYTQFYWAINARSLMNFLKLRLHSSAQWEIQEYARVIRTIFEEKMPWTAEVFFSKNNI